VEKSQKLDKIADTAPLASSWSHRCGDRKASGHAPPFHPHSKLSPPIARAWSAQSVPPSRRTMMRSLPGWSGDRVRELLLPRRRADEESCCAPTNGAKTGLESCCCPDDERTRSLAARRRMEQRRGRGAAVALKTSGCTT
jgi:hypothetical protein